MKPSIFVLIAVLVRSSKSLQSFKPLAGKEIASFKDKSYVLTFAAYENATATIDGLRCDDPSKPEKLKWALHRISCGSNMLNSFKSIDNIRPWTQPCKTDVLTEVVYSQFIYVNCTPQNLPFSPLAVVPFRNPGSSAAECNISSNSTNQTYSNAFDMYEVGAQTWKKGVYAFFIEFQGKTSSKVYVTVRNSHDGYLMASSEPLLSFCLFFMFPAYCLLLLTCLLTYFWSWRLIEKLHWCVILTIVAGFIETALETYLVFAVDKFGLPMNEWNLAVDVIQALKDTSIRLLLIAISMGYGCGKTSWMPIRIYAALALVGVFHFLVSILSSLRSGLLVYGAMVLVSTVSIAWIAIGLRETKKMLERTGDKTRLRIYKSLEGFLVWCFLSVVLLMATIKIVELASDCLAMQLSWLQDATSIFVALTLLAIICLILRPGKASLLYATLHSEEHDEEDDTLFTRTATQESPNNDD